jgi:hypothetical protein
MIDRGTLNEGRADDEVEEIVIRHPMVVGRVLARADRTSDAVLAMTEAGASPLEVMDGLVMAGQAERVMSLKDRLNKVLGRQPKTAVYRVVAGLRVPTSQR